MAAAHRARPAQAQSGPVLRRPVAQFYSGVDKPDTSRPAKGHKTYPYLLGGLRVDRPDQVWCSDITYIPMRRGFLYLIAIMDWSTRKVLAWRVSNTLGNPPIFNGVHP